MDVFIVFLTVNPWQHNSDLLDADIPISASRFVICFALSWIRSLYISHSHKVCPLWILNGYILHHLGKEYENVSHFLRKHIL